jgi:hypothetical protein
MLRVQIEAGAGVVVHGGSIQWRVELHRFAEGRL